MAGEMISGPIQGIYTGICKERSFRDDIGTEDGIKGKTQEWAIYEETRIGHFEQYGHYNCKTISE